MGNSNWTWLKDYLQTTQNAVKNQLIPDNFDNNGNQRKVPELNATVSTTPAPWRFAVAAFFLQTQHKGYPGSADFSTAGLPSAWGPKAKAAGKTYTYSLNGELTWRLHIHAFFNKTNSVTYNTNDGGTKTDATADFSEAGDPHAWYNIWAETSFPKVLRTGDKMPKIKRKGYLFAGWHYGTEQGFTRDQKVADDKYNENVTNNKHIWARWMELCIYEGYPTPDPHFLQEPAKFNYNEELMNLGARTAHYVDIYRNIAPGMYNTLSLPFAIPKNHMDFFKKVTDENGAYVFDPDNGGLKPSILVFDGIEEVDEHGEKVIEFRFHELQDDEQILANTPFLFKPAQEEQLTSRLHFWQAYFSSAQPSAVQVGSVTFVPVLKPTKITIPDGAMGLILVADNRLAELTASETEMLGLRGYFITPEQLAQQPARIAIKEPAPTGSENTTTSPENHTYKVLEDQRIYIITEQQKYNILGGVCQ